MLRRSLVCHCVLCMTVPLSSCQCYISVFLSGMYSWFSISYRRVNYITAHNSRSPEQKVFTTDVITISHSYCENNCDKRWSLKQTKCKVSSGRWICFRGRFITESPNKDFFSKIRLSLFYHYSPLTSCTKSEKS